MLNNIFAFAKKYYHVHGTLTTNINDQRSVNRLNLIHQCKVLLDVKRPIQ